jgi:hypothetical protein
MQGRIGVFTATLVLLIVSVPANAMPQRIEVAHISALVSFEDEVVILWNTTLTDFCVWLEEEDGGPPPAAQPITWQFTDTGQGATLASARGEASVELWRFEGTPDPLCAAALAGDAPWATGTARLQFNDNDRFESGRRTNSYGAHAQGKVRDAAGTRWHVSWNWRGIIDPISLEYRMWTEHFTIRPTGG